MSDPVKVSESFVEEINKFRNDLTANKLQLADISIQLMVLEKQREHLGTQVVVLEKQRENMIRLITDSSKIFQDRLTEIAKSHGIKTEGEIWNIDFNTMTFTKVEPKVEPKVGLAV